MKTQISILVLISFFIFGCASKDDNATPGKVLKLVDGTEVYSELIRSKSSKEAQFGDISGKYPGNLEIDKHMSVMKSYFGSYIRKTGTAKTYSYEYKTLAPGDTSLARFVRDFNFPINEKGRTFFILTRIHKTGYLEIKFTRYRSGDTDVTFSVDQTSLPVTGDPDLDNGTHFYLPMDKSDSANMYVGTFNFK